MERVCEFRICEVVAGKGEIQFEGELDQNVYVVFFFKVLDMTRIRSPVFILFCFSSGVWGVAERRLLVRELFCRCSLLFGTDIADNSSGFQSLFHCLTKSSGF